jgi:MFS family permease
MQDPKSNSSVATKINADSSSQRSLVLALIPLAVTAYGLTLAGFLMLSGRVGDISGHKKLFIIGVLLFSLASFTGGLAPSEIVLILARLQAIEHSICLTYVSGCNYSIMVKSPTGIVVKTMPLFS